MVEPHSHPAPEFFSLPDGMLTSRAPLFSVSLAFAIGCVLGIDDFLRVWIALVLLVAIGIAWASLRGREAASLATFYAMTVCAGLAYTLLQTHAIAPDDLRRLPEEKSLATTQWRGVIVQEPQSQLTAHASKRALDRTAVVLRIIAWRPAEGRLFGADINTPWQSASGEIRGTILGPAKDLRLGDQIAFAAALESIPDALVPGDFDAREYAARQGIYFESVISPENWIRTGIGYGDWWTRLSYLARDWAYARLQIGLEDDPRTADFLAGMLIGYRQQIPLDIEQDFRRTGTIHVFAVSGQNIAEMTVVALVLLQLIGLVRWRWAWMIAPVVLLYCLLTGSPASAVRATVMALAVLLAWKLGRPLHALGCWSLALLLLLFWNPLILLDVGAQLSFGIVLGLILVAPPITRFLMRPFLPDPFLPPSLLTPAQRFEKRAWWCALGLVGTGIAAVFMCEPITAVTFHQITPISILANLVVVPVAGLITAIGTMSVAVSLFSTLWAGWLNNTNWLLAKCLIVFVGWLAHKPGAMINVPDLAALESSRPSFVVAPMPGTACLLVRTAEQSWLINAGRETPAPATAWHFLQFYGVNRLDGLVLAQMSAPDNGGATAIARDFQPAHLVIPVLRTRSPLEKQLPETVAATSLPPETWAAGKKLDLGSGVSAEVLEPTEDSTATHADDRALVVLFHAGAGSLLWAGRIGLEAQQKLLEDHPDLHADVLIMGTESTPDTAWLQALGARDWLQIAARDARTNVMNAPTIPEDCQVWRLRETGAVDIHFEPGRILLRPWLAVPK